MKNWTIHQGRVVAATIADAVEAIRDNLAAKGFAAKDINPYPCPVQPWKGVIWWEYQVEVTENVDAT